MSEPATEQKKRQCGVDYPRDMVIVHQIEKGKCVPSLSHFVVKLETYLRMANIPYEPCYDETVGGPRKKIPWIEYNGTVMSDSQHIIDYLNKKFNRDLNKHLSPKERATAWAIQKWLEESTYWLNIYTRWCIRGDDMIGVYTPNSPLYETVRTLVSNYAHAQGTARHTDEEVGRMMEHDLTMLSEILGEEPYIMGDKPTELDCAAFSLLAQIRWSTPESCPGKSLMKEKLKNLMAFTDRIKEAYWPDWSEQIQGDGGEH